MTSIQIKFTVNYCVYQKDGKGNECIIDVIQSKNKLSDVVKAYLVNKYEYRILENVTINDVKNHFCFIADNYLLINDDVIYLVNKHNIGSGYFYKNSDYDVKMLYEWRLIESFYNNKCSCQQMIGDNIENRTIENYLGNKSIAKSVKFPTISKYVVESSDSESSDSESEESSESESSESESSESESSDSESSESDSESEFSEDNAYVSHCQTYLPKVKMLPNVTVDELDSFEKLRFEFRNKYTNHRRLNEQIWALRQSSDNISAKQSITTTSLESTESRSTESTTQSQISDTLNSSDDKSIDISFNKFDLNMINDDSIIAIIGKPTSQGGSSMIEGLLKTLIETLNASYTEMAHTLIISDKITNESINNSQIKIIPEYDCDIVYDYMSKPYGCIIFNDCVLSKLTNDQTFNDLLLNNKKYKKTVVITMQYPFSSKIKDMVDYVFMFNDGVYTIKRTLHERYAQIIPTLNQFSDLFDDITENNNCMVVTKDAKVDCSTYHDHVFQYRM